MEGHHHHHHHHHLHQLLQLQQQQQQMNLDTGGGGGGGGGDRVPQWSHQETREFLVIRAELDQTFMETKRNKSLWEIISNKMKEMGYYRSADQCKCKWKNLVTRYKGSETMEDDAMRQQQFPFYNELQMIFTARMQRMLWLEVEGGSSSSLKKRSSGRISSDDEDENEESEEDKTTTTTTKKIRKKGKNVVSTGSGGSNSHELKDKLNEMMKQQMQLELQWREAMEAREEKRKMKEMEWRQRMEALEQERLMIDRIWREREEERRMRQEARAEKRDALIQALLNKLRREDHM